MTRNAIVAAAVAVVALAAGCGADDRVADTEAAIASVLAQRLDEPAAAVAVACPDDADLDEGSTIECEVAISGSDAQRVGLEIGAEGGATLTSAVIPAEAAEAYLVTELSGPAQSEVTVDCGPRPLLVGAVGDTFTCEVVRETDGVAFDVTVEVAALDGTVRYRVETTTSSP